MATPSDDQIEELIIAAFDKIDDPCSPDVTLEVFKAISRFPELEKQYRLLGGKTGSYLNTRIGKQIRKILGREVDEPPKKLKNNKFITGYTRFKREPCDQSRIRKK